MGKYFGTDGFRGEANINLTVEHAYKVGRYIGWYFNQKSSSRAKIVIGKDTRRSSYMFENALVAGLTASGADAYMPVSYTHLQAADAEELVDLADASILVVRQHTALVKDINETISILNSAEGTMLGCVYNDVFHGVAQTARNYGYKYAYGSGYGYGSKYGYGNQGYGYGYEMCIRDRCLHTKENIHIHDFCGI